MGVNAKIACKTKTKDVFQVADALAKSLDVYIREFKKPKFQPDESNKFVTISMRAESQMIQLLFKVKNESRMLSVFFDCDCDNYDKFGEGEKSLSASLGMWGLSDELTLIVAKTLSQFGETYYTFNDCSQPTYTPFDESQSV